VGLRGAGRVAAAPHGLPRSLPLWGRFRNIARSKKAGGRGLGGRSQSASLTSFLRVLNLNSTRTPRLLSSGSSLHAPVSSQGPSCAPITAVKLTNLSSAKRSA
jgi:hypothetical protein